MLNQENLDKWRFYFKDIISPDSYINMAFYSLISSALQRRVWVGPEEMPLFPNMYIILVGEPGTGKGLVIKPATEILRYHKTNPKLQNVLNSADEQDFDPEMIQEFKESLASLSGTKFSKEEYIEDPLVIPLGADSTTFEALIVQHKKARCWFRSEQPSKVLAPHCRYMHNSLVLMLEEVSTLFRKKTEDVINYLLKAYDCGHFEYRSIGRGVDCIRNPCLNILGGTTPGFLIESFTDKLLNEGFSSRTLFVYDIKPRFYRFGIKQFTDEQLECRKSILDHILKLTGLFGQVTYEPDALVYFTDYFEKELPTKRSNDSVRLNAYYARKNITAQKLAMAIHFGRNMNSFTIKLEECQEALKVLEELEHKMHLAFQGGDNDFARACNNIVRYLENVNKIEPGQGRAVREIWKNFPMKETELIDILHYLASTNKIVEDKNSKGEVVYKIVL